MDLSLGLLKKPLESETQVRVFRIHIFTFLVIPGCLTSFFALGKKKSSQHPLDEQRLKLCDVIIESLIFIKRNCGG